MRSGLLMLTSILTMVAVFFLVRYFRDDGNDGLGPVIEATETAPSVVVWVGGDDDLEVVVRPVFPDVAREQFDRDLLNSHLSPGDPRVYYRVWLANHGAVDVTLPVAPGRALSAPDGTWSTESLSALPGARNEGLPRFLETFVRLESGDGRHVVAARELASFLVAAPPSPDLEELAAMRFAGTKPLALRSGRVRTDDLLAWEKRPRGRFGARVSYDEASRGASEQASRSR